MAGTEYTSAVRLGPQDALAGCSCPTRRTGTRPRTTGGFS